MPLLRILLIGLVLISAKVHGESERENRLRKEAERYVSKVESLVAPWVENAAQSDLKLHKSVERTAPRCHPKAPGCASYLGWTLLAGLTPWAVFGAYMAPLPTMPLWLGIPLTTLAWHLGGKWDRKKAAAQHQPWLSESHYAEVMRQLPTAREGITWFEVFGWSDQPWSQEAFKVFEDVIRQRTALIVEEFEAEVERRHAMHLPPDDYELDDLTARYLKLWTLVALLDIEQRRFSASFLGRSHPQATTISEEASLQADECRIAILRMGSAGYWE